MQLTPPPPSFGTLAEALFDGVYVLDRERRIVFWNDAAERITGYPASEVLGRHCSDGVLVHVDDGGQHLCAGRCPAAACLRAAVRQDARVFLHHRDGHRVPVDVRVVPLAGDDGEVTHVAEVFSDHRSPRELTARIAELEQLVMLDPLTQLPNRRYLDLRLEQRLLELRRYGWGWGALLIDADHFKAVNDQYGHLVGDRILRTLARTLSHAMRASDVLGRWGGDEFLALVTLAESDDLSLIARRLQALAGASQVDLPGADPLVPRVSVGGTVARPEDSLGDLLQRADDALWRAKAAGRGTAVVAL